MVKRVEISLTKQERQTHRNLKQEPDQALLFWETVCGERELDFRTVLPDPESGRMTALPLNHGKHWCWPYPLICKDSPEKQLRFLKLDD